MYIALSGYSGKRRSRVANTGHADCMGGLFPLSMIKMFFVSNVNGAVHLNGIPFPRKNDDGYPVP